MNLQRPCSTMFQAVLRRDHGRIVELAAEGQHPLTIIERCIEVRGDAVKTLMVHVSKNCAQSRAVVERVIQHLWMIDRYPVAFNELKEWLD